MKSTTITKAEANDAATLEEYRKVLVAVTYTLEELLAKQVGSEKLVEAIPTKLLQEKDFDTKSVVLNSAYLRDLSYRLRTTLTPILGYSHLLLNKEVSASDTTKALTSILRNAELQLTIIEEIEKIKLDDINLIC